jgi:hypothetical protein
MGDDDVLSELDIDSTNIDDSLGFVEESDKLDGQDIALEIKRRGWMVGRCLWGEDRLRDGFGELGRMSG